MCRWELIRAVSRVGVLEGFPGGSFLRFMSEVMPVWVRVWRVHVRLVTMGIMSTWVSCECERNSFARGVCFSMVMASVHNIIVRALFLFSYLNFTNRRVSAVGGRVAH
jgi:hypothetical protein